MENGGHGPPYRGIPGLCRSFGDRGSGLIAAEWAGEGGGQRLNAIGDLAELRHVLIGIAPAGFVGDNF